MEFMKCPTGRIKSELTVYQNGENADTADVLWQESQWPRTWLAGINNTSIPVIMADEFAFPNPYDALASGNRIGSGYTLAHEWGHYYYAVDDEYAKQAGDEPVPYSVMNYQWAAINGGEELRWLNFSIRKNNLIDGRLRRTAQNRIYQASDWETLIRPPSYDPPTARFINRPFYPELQTVSPIDELDTHIELPDCQARARSELNIVWETPSSTAPFVPHSGSSFTYLPSVQILPSQTPVYPEPVRVMARVLVPSEGRTVTKANVMAELITPSNDTIEFPLSDNGISPDAKAFDGLYTGYAPYSENGEYIVNVSFNNNDGLAELTTDGFDSTISPEGDTYSSTNVLVGENFDVSASNTFTMGNYTSDDHGNVLEDATMILDNNVEEPGRIDYAGDSDWFRVELGESFGLGKVSDLVIRMTDMAFDMEPKISVYDEQGNLIRSKSFTGLAINNNQYPTVLIEISAADSHVFVEVIHANGEATKGTYYISAGAPLKYEMPYYLYLPLIR